MKLRLPALLADIVWRLLAPGRHRQADARRDIHAEGFQTLVGLIEALPNTATVGELKGKVTTKAPSSVRDAIGVLVEPGQ